ncbi:MAG: glycosyltransferase family 2 protein [Rhodoferax sp.]|uniref:glycosyltransferase family 2 protein n=1 Tax=Rhodoferax sp. TaxID=50421 RepID=UPI001B786B3B|nr:glycosyltransferase family 2 protein [Rhodoferax sp.]MBP9904739.1 glycosyltransferase family 2 protein [Rhodoferax sp.]
MTKDGSTSRVGVVVLNWNGWRDTLACLASLQKLDYPDFDLIVVDNGSTDDSVQHILAHQPAVTLLQTGANLGFGGGCNVGIRYALGVGADYIWLINSDATVAVGALSALVTVAQGNPSLGAVGSLLFDAGGVDRIQLWGGGRVNLWTGRSHHQRVPAALDFVSGASMLLRREALQQVGLFDDRSFFMYWEDTDLGARLRQAGWLLGVAEQSRVWHKQSASLGRGSPLLDQYFTRSALRFFRKHAPIPWVPTVSLMVMMLLKRVFCADSQRACAVLKGFVDA